MSKTEMNIFMTGYDCVKASITFQNLFKNIRIDL